MEVSNHVFGNTAGFYVARANASDDSNPVFPATPKGQSSQVVFSATAPGLWAFCKLIEHRLELILADRDDADINVRHEGTHL